MRVFDAIIGEPGPRRVTRLATPMITTLVLDNQHNSRDGDIEPPLAVIGYTFVVVLGYDPLSAGVDWVTVMREFERVKIGE